MSARQAPRHAPTSPPPRQIRLRSVGGIVGRSGRLLRWSTFVFGTLAVLLLFGLVAFNALIVRNQSALDDIDREIAVATDANQTLRFEVAELESPERVRQIAVNWCSAWSTPKP